MRRRLTGRPLVAGGSRLASASGALVLAFALVLDHGDARASCPELLQNNELSSGTIAPWRVGIDSPSFNGFLKVSDDQYQTLDLFLGSPPFGSKFTLVQPVAVQAGASYRLSFYMYANGSQAAVVRVRNVDQPLLTRGLDQTFTVSTNISDATSVFTFTAAATDPGAELAIELQYRGGADYFKFDSLFMSEQSSPSCPGGGGVGGDAGAGGRGGIAGQGAGGASVSGGGRAGGGSGGEGSPSGGTSGRGGSSGAVGSGGGVASSGGVGGAPEPSGVGGSGDGGAGRGEPGGPGGGSGAGTGGMAAGSGGGATTGDAAVAGAGGSEAGASGSEAGGASGSVGSGGQAGGGHAGVSGPDGGVSGDAGSVAGRRSGGCGCGVGGAGSLASSWTAAAILLGAFRRRRGVARHQRNPGVVVTISRS